METKEVDGIEFTQMIFDGTFCTYLRQNRNEYYYYYGIGGTNTFPQIGDTVYVNHDRKLWSY